MTNPFKDNEKVLENEFCYAIFDGFPVSEGHMLVVPKREVPLIFDLNKDEYIGCFELVAEVKNFLQKKFNPDGFNIGINCNASAGQTVFIAHIHIIPRYKGDVDNPRGGIRNIIPEKGDY